MFGHLKMNTFVHFHYKKYLLTQRPCLIEERFTDLIEADLLFWRLDSGELLNAQSERVAAKITDSNRTFTANYITYSFDEFESLLNRENTQYIQGM